MTQIDYEVVPSCKGLIRIRCKVYKTDLSIFLLSKPVEIVKEVVLVKFSSIWQN